MPTELAVLSPFKSDRSHFFAHIRNLIRFWEGSFLRWSIFLNHVGWQSLTWGRTGGSACTPTPGFQPSYSRPILSSLPPPLFFLIFFRVTPPQIQIIRQSPKPIYLTPAPAHFSPKASPPPPPPPTHTRHTNTPPCTDCGLAIVFIQCVNCFLCVCWFLIFVSMALHVLDKIYTSK